MPSTGYERYVQEVRRALLPHRDRHRARFLVGYMNSALPILGLDVPTQRRVAKTPYSFLSLPASEVDQVWDYIFMHGTEFEVLSQALFYFQARRERAGLHEWAILRRWVRRIDNWAHSDQLSDMFAHIHERHPAAVYPVYQKWNASRRPWVVRQSLVGLFYYARGRRKQPPFAKALAMVKGAFSHPDMFVQKGVGWTLREMYNVYPERTYAFLLNRAAELSPIAWQAATEKLSKGDKQRLFTLRKRV